VSEHFVHQPLVGGACILQPEGYHYIIVARQLSHECRLAFVPGMHFDLVVMEIKKKKRMRLKFKMLKDTLAHHPFYLKGLQGAKLKN